MGVFGRAVDSAEVHTVLMYGAAAVIFGGGAGIWLPLIMGKAVSADALATYVFALLAPFYVDTLLHEKYWEKLTKKSRMAVGLGCTLSGSFALVALIRDGKSWDISAGVFGILAVLVVWFVLAIYSERFVPDPTVPPKGPLGGDNVAPGALQGGGLQ